MFLLDTSSNLKGLQIIILFLTTLSSNFSSSAHPDKLFTQLWLILIKVTSFWRKRVVYMITCHNNV
jgi:hypothetical protein